MCANALCANKRVNAMTAPTKKSKTVKVMSKNEIQTLGPQQRLELTHGVLDRVGILARIWSPYTAYIAVLILLGIPSLHIARSESFVWAGSLLILLAMVLPLVERWLVTTTSGMARHHRSVRVEVQSSRKRQHTQRRSYRR
jgi:hypothetical protein